MLLIFCIFHIHFLNIFGVLLLSILANDFNEEGESRVGQDSDLGHVPSSFHLAESSISLSDMNLALPVRWLGIVVTFQQTLLRTRKTELFLRFFSCISFRAFWAQAGLLTLHQTKKMILHIFADVKQACYEFKIDSFAAFKKSISISGSLMRLASILGIFRILMKNFGWYRNWQTGCSADMVAVLRSDNWVFIIWRWNVITVIDAFLYF